MHILYIPSFLHSFIPLACAECNDSLLFSGASSIPLSYVLLTATLLHKLYCICCIKSHFPAFMVRQSIGPIQSLANTDQELISSFILNKILLYSTSTKQRNSKRMSEHVKMMNDVSGNNNINIPMSYAMFGSTCTETNTGWPYFNHLTPNGHLSGHTAPLTYRCFSFFIYSTDIRTEYFKHAAYSPFFPLQNVVYFIMLPFLFCIIHILYTGVLKCKRKFRRQRVNINKSL
jgi:hypothetical protein